MAVIFFFVSMVVHRDYTSPSESSIKIFKDRIEFFNPGKLAEGLTVARLLSGDYTSTIRNKQIASVLKDAGIIERYGSGIKRILEGDFCKDFPSGYFWQTRLRATSPITRRAI